MARSSYVLLTTIVVLISATIAGFEVVKNLHTVHAAPQSSPIADGSISPSSIPDDTAYSNFLLIASAGANDSEVAHRRVAAVLAELPLSNEDRDVFKGIVAGYRNNLETLNAATASALGQHSASAVRAVFARRQQLLSSTISSLTDNLTYVGSGSLAKYVATEKKNMKLYEIPSMEEDSPGPLGYLFRIFSFTQVHAQSMNPTGSTYTHVTGDYTGSMYSTAVTNATSYCGCHQSRASTTVSYNGIQQSGYNSGGEQVTADAMISLDDDNFGNGGTISGVSTHYSYCPLAHLAFINRGSSGQASGRFIQAYYYCDWDSANNACTSSLGIRTYHRCNPTGTCDSLYAFRVKSGRSFYRYALLNVLFVQGTFVNACTAGSNITYCDRCLAPDIKP